MAEEKKSALSGVGDSLLKGLSGGLVSGKGNSLANSSKSGDSSTGAINTGIKNFGSPRGNPNRGMSSEKMAIIAFTAIVSVILYKKL